MTNKADQLVSLAHHNYLKQVVEKTKTPPTTIAADIGVAPSTLTRMVGKKYNGKSTLRATTLAKLESYSSLPQPTLAPSESGVEPVQGHFEDATPYSVSDGDSALNAAISAIIGGRRNIEVWTIKARSLESSGFMPGDIVLVDLNTSARAGEPVCAQVFDRRRGAFETIMRINEPPYLVASSLDPSLRKPLLVDNDQVIVKGLVLPYRLRPFRAK